MKKQQNINSREQKFGDGFEMPSMEDLKKIKIKNMIERCRSRHIAKQDKTYRQYRSSIFSGGKFLHFYYPFKGMTKEEIECILSSGNTPYGESFSSSSSASLFMECSLLCNLNREQELIMTQPKMLKNFSKIFSASYVLNMLNGQNISHFKSIYSSINLHEDVKIKDVFNAYYNLLLAYYKNEYVYKNILIQDIKSKEVLHNYALFSELNIGKDSRVDIAHFSQSNHAYEIKTEFDTFNRLEKQLMDYATGFEYVSIVIPESKLKTILASVNDSIGIIILNKNNSLDMYRSANSNLDLVTHGGLFSLLYEKEFSSIMKKYLGHFIDLSSFESRKLYFSKFQNIDIESLHGDVVKIIKSRTKHEKFQYVLHNAPKYLLPIGLNVNIQKEAKSLISMLNSSIHDFNDHVNMMQHRKLFDFS